MSEFDLSNGINTKEEVEVTQEVDKWKNRRKMAYFSLYGTAIVIGVLALLWLVHPTSLDTYPKIESTVTTIILGWFSIIALYFGASSLADIFGNKVK